jgi:uncharacterized protein
MMEQSNLICVKSMRGKGRGVFARRAIKKGAIIERVPVVLVPIRHLVRGKKSPTLACYFYQWDARHVAICLGYGSLYNHSFEPTARYVHGKDQMTFRALREIAAGEEITINYNFHPKDRTPMWFEVQ